MELSVICPTLNEVKFIDQLIEDLCANDGLIKEILIVDGGSTDGTLDKVSLLQKKYSNLLLIHNPRKTATAAFNIGCGIASGEFIAFVGAHANYSKDYFVVGVKALRNEICDAVGGPLKQLGKTEKGQAIAYVMSSKAGVGNTEFRTSTEKAYVDSVAFAIYKKSAIETVGLMDEKLPVNQDDEFHYRLNANGFKIMMIPEMKATYYVRETYGRLWKQYFNYGLYKPLVLKKVKDSVRLRHLIPAAFVLYILTFPLVLLSGLWIVPLVLYFLLTVYFSFKFRGKLKIKLMCIPVFPILHFSYGSGFLIGLFKRN